MRARQLLDGSGLGYRPETARAMHQALESAWEAIAPQYSGDAYAAEKARLRLAECILAATSDGMTDAEQIGLLAHSMFRISN